VSERDGLCPGYALSATSYTRTSVEEYLAAAMAERDRVEQRLEAARRRCSDAEELLGRLDALAGGAAGPHDRTPERSDGEARVCADG
jgi:hypothetical protein